MKPRLILVTGGTGTLGSGLVRALAGTAGQSSAWRVVANYARDEARAESLRQQTHCELWRADVGDQAQVAAMFEAFPAPFAVIHAAAVSQDRLLARQGETSWRESLRVNATGSFLVVRSALERLQDGGRLILIGSRAAERGNAGQGAYAAGKAALMALGKSAAREGAGRRLAVNIICPGFVPSDLSQSLTPPSLEALRRQSIWHEIGNVDQVASTVQWLLGDAASGISGQVVHCDSRI